MTQTPSLAAIHAAEMRVAGARRETVDSLRRGQVALRATLTRPAAVALAAGAAGLLAFLVGRRLRRPEPPAPAATTATHSAAGLLATIIARYAMQHLPLLLEQVRAARQARTTQADPTGRSGGADPRPALLH